MCGVEGGAVSAAAEHDEVTADEEVDRGVRRVRSMQDPRLPTPEEVREHELTHLPYRCWCRHCVRGRGKEAPHVTANGDGALPEVHFDFAFMGDEGDAGNTIPMLVAKVRDNKMVLATAVPRKSTGEFVVDRVMAFLREVGIDKLDIIAKSDQEPAIMSVVEGVGSRKALGSRELPGGLPPKQRDCGEGDSERDGAGEGPRATLRGSGACPSEPREPSSLG